MHDRPSKQLFVPSLVLPSRPAQNQFISAASFWLPRYVVDSAWLEHAPFAFWLSEALAPRRFVELGTHSGFSYLCFCQAFDALGLDTTSFAVDTWKGDEHSGYYGSDVLRDLRAHHDMNYSASSRLVESTFDEAASQFDDASIDLLHIDGRHDYASVVHDFSTWQPKLSDRAVVLFHDTNVYERGFGVNRLWRELRNQFRSFEFLHGHGLGVLGIGAELPLALRRLCEADSDLGLKNDIRRTYARLGLAITAGWRCEQLVEHTTNVEATLQLARSRVLEAEGESKALLNELELAKTERDGFSAAHADLIAERDILAREKSDLIVQGDESARRNSHLTAERDALVRTHNEMVTERDTLARAYGDLVVERDTLARGHSDLTAERDALAGRSVDLTRECDALTRAHADLIAARDGLLRDRDDVVRERDTLLASRSWQLTAPLRAVRRLFARKT